MSKNKIKILFITYCRAMLGANLCLISLIQDLKERYDVESTVLMYEKEDGPLKEELERNHISYVVSPMKFWAVSKEKNFKYLRGLKISIENRKNIKKIIKKIGHDRFDLIYTNNSTVQIGAILSQKLNIPHIWHVREFGSFFSDYDFEYNYPKFIVRKYFSQASKVITISDSMNRYVKSTIGKDSDVIRIYDGIENKKKKRERWNENNPVQFCIVGALQEGKNQIELIRASKQLKQEYNDQFHVNIIGSGEKYEEVLKKYVVENELENQVTFWGYQKNIDEILEQMDVGVICSLAEGFGRVTVEYMYASMPVIGAGAGATPEIIKDGSTGYIYKLGNDFDLENRMSLFIKNREKIKELGEQAYIDATNRFSLKNNTDYIYKVISNIV